MPDETTATATEAQPVAAATETAQQATTTGGGHGPGGGANAPEPERLPHLTIGVDNDKWVRFLQQTLNYYFQMQVVAEDGHYGPTTEHVVQHYRALNSLGSDEGVTIPVWVKLGVEDSHAAWERQRAQQGNRTGGQQGNRAGGQQTGAGAGQHGAGAGHTGAGHGNEQGAATNYEVDKHIQMVDLPNDEAGWAACMAAILNTMGQSFTVESLCERAGVNPQDRKTAQEVQSVGTNLGLQVVNCNGGTPGGWAEALNVHGPLWTPNPINDNHVFIVSGVWGSGEAVQIQVQDPAANRDQWMPFTEFTQQYGINESYQGQLLGG